jgi:hypothetical protein
MGFLLLFLASTSAAEYGLSVFLGLRGFYSVSDIEHWISSSEFIYCVEGGIRVVSMPRDAVLSRGFMVLLVSRRSS